MPSTSGRILTSRKDFVAAEKARFGQGGARLIRQWAGVLGRPAPHQPQLHFGRRRAGRRRSIEAQAHAPVSARLAAPRLSRREHLGFGPRSSLAFPLAQTRLFFARRTALGYLVRLPIVERSRPGSTVAANFSNGLATTRRCNRSGQGQSGQGQLSNARNRGIIAMLATRAIFRAGA
jgi:hypothetical protein